MGKNIGSFQENLLIISDELELAKKWERASIILTTHKSIHSRKKLQQSLQKKLSSCGYKIIAIRVNEHTGNFINRILGYENIENTVFYIENIGWGGGDEDRDGYRALNLYREVFVERKMKVIFFLSDQEAANLPNYAPDFWAFRHRILSFASLRGRRNISLPLAGLLLWHNEKQFVLPSELEQKLLGLETMFDELPEQNETIALRIDLLHEIGFLAWQAGDLYKAEKSLQKGLELAGTYEIKDLLAKHQNGLSILHYEKGDLPKALAYADLAQINGPQDCIPYLNQAVILFSMGKRYFAFQKGNKAISMCPINPWGWNMLGFLYFFAGQTNNAIKSFQSAIEISPDDIFFSESIVVCYAELGLYKKAKNHLDQIHAYNNSIISDALAVYIQSTKEEAANYLKYKKRNSELENVNIVRNPILAILLSP